MLAVCNSQALPARLIRELHFGIHSRFQRRQIVLNRLPDQLLIDTLIFMTIDISGCRDRYPSRFSDDGPCTPLAIVSSLPR